MATYAKYHPGETYKCQTEVYFEGNLTDPASITCEILDPLGVSKASGNMTIVVVGRYTYTYALPSDAVKGKWTAVSTATNAAGDIEIEPLHFIVENPQSTTIE